MNEYDSARMIEGLRLAGWEPTADMKRADLMLFNSCSIREKAVSKLASALGRAAAVKRRRPDALLAVTGCTAQLKGDWLCKQVPEIDLIVGPDRYTELVATARSLSVPVLTQDLFLNFLGSAVSPAHP